MGGISYLLFFVVNESTTMAGVSNESEGDAWWDLIHNFSEVVIYP
jgi:hypothetical protein